MKHLYNLLFHLVPVRGINIRLLVLTCLFLFANQLLQAQVSNNISITPVTTPSLTPCSGQGTFVVRVANITGTTINNLVFRDSMPSGINYVTGSVSGTGVTFGTTVTPSNVVTFNIASVPANGSVDISFTVAVNCNVSTNSANIFNTYRVSWGTNFTDPHVTPTYVVSFPSISISVDSVNITRSCGTPFVRRITVCNGGFGALDSVTIRDTSGSPTVTNLVIVNFNMGTVTGQGTRIARTVLKAADFATVGNGDGKLDQNECITVVDTLLITSSQFTPIPGKITASWGCNGATCSPTQSFVVSTVVDPTVEEPLLTRVSFEMLNTDSSGQLYGRTNTYREVITNNSNVRVVSGTSHTASSHISYINKGLRYIDTSTVRMSINGGAPFRPSFLRWTTSPYTTGGTPHRVMATVLAPASYPGRDSVNSISILLPDLDPGDTMVITFNTSTVGPITRVSDSTHHNNNGNFYFGGCGGTSFNYYLGNDGPSIGGTISARLFWRGQCNTQNFITCRADATGLIFNGISHVQHRPGNDPVFLARFRNFSFTDSTKLTSGNDPCKTYNDLDTVKLLMTAAVMDLPFYTDKSKFFLKIYTNGGVKWDGNLAKVYGRFTAAGWPTNTNWFADRVEDNTAVDSTILVHFKKSNCPVPDFSVLNTHNSYGGSMFVFGGFRLNMQFVNVCPGPAVKELLMTRVYDIDTTNAEPAIEAGPAPGNYKFSWNSNCPLASCADGVQISSFEHGRTTLGQPDNNNDGVADASGTLNMAVVKTKRITWGDTLQMKYKMVIRTTQAGGVPHLYINTSINEGLTAAENNACNAMLKKTAPQVVLKRPGVGSFSATGTEPVTTTNTYLMNFSLQDAGGISVPGITAYEDGDTVEVTENVIYWTPHFNWGLKSWNFIHSPYTSTVANPTAAERFICDSVACSNIETIDWNAGSFSDHISSTFCSDSVEFRTDVSGQSISASCGSTFFPGEARDIMTPTVFKIVMPVARWTVQRINVTWLKKINSSCLTPINNQVVPASLYSYSGDTLIMDLVQLGQFYGQDIFVNQQRSYFIFNIVLKYTPTATQLGCGQDHSDIRTIFDMYHTFKTTYPVDSSVLTNRNFRTMQLNQNNVQISQVFLGWPGGNFNNVTFPANNSVSVTQPNVVIPITYIKPRVTGGTDFIAIPNRPGIIVDSVVDKVTGLQVPTVPGSSIYEVGYLPDVANTTRNFDIYTRVQACQRDTLFIYADRTPCTGYPVDWATYGCQTGAGNAIRSAFVYHTFGGELQMQDSLYSTQKNICTSDTVQFKVVNTQTQNATAVKVSFELPQGMSLLPGQTQLKKANGSFVTVPDPVLSNGVHSWTLPANDTLFEIGATPDNIMYLRCGVITECGFISGSQITSSVAGNVACGPITSLFNTNPPPLNINGAPALNYLTNPQVTVTQIDNCNGGTTFDYKIAMDITGSPTGSGDSIRVMLPPEYVYASYNAAAPGSHNAPPAQPVITTMPNGSTQLSWLTPAGVAAGDSIVYTFQYSEVAPTNKCAASAARSSWVSSVINGSAFCVSTATNCQVSIFNGSDTTVLQTLKPALTASVTTANLIESAPYYDLHMQGNIMNTGSAALPAGTDLVMEVFMDLDNSGTVNAGDHTFRSFVYSGGLGVGASIPFNYVDSVLRTACPTCPGKNVLLRFSNSPSSPPGASQCLCDSMTVTTATTSTILPLGLGSFDVTMQSCNTASITWKTFTESQTGSSFELQASHNGTVFYTIETIAAAGNPNGSTYERTVVLTGPVTYYRLALKDNGNVKYSSVRLVKNRCNTPGVVTAYPNPVTDLLTVVGAQQGSMLSLFDANGRLIQQRRASGSGTDIISTARLATGIYMLKVAARDGTLTTIKVKKE